MSLEKLKELVENDELAEKIWTSGYMIPTDKFNEKNKEIKELKAQLTSINEDWEKKLDDKDLELYNLKTANMSELEKAKAENQRLQELTDKASLKNNRYLAEAKLAKAGITDEDDIKAIVDTYVDSNELKTLERLDTFLKINTKLTSQIKTNVEEEIIQKATEVETGDKAIPPVEKDEIDSIVDELLNEDFGY